MAQPAMLSRRALLAAGTGLVAAPALLTPALAQGRWPDRPVRFLQGFAAGGTTDIVARLTAPSMAAAFGQPVVVENRSGAGGTLAAEALARSNDGHTLMLLNNGFAVSAALYRRLPYDPRADIEPIAMVASIGLVLLAGTGPDAPADMADLVRRAKARAGADQCRHRRRRQHAAFRGGSHPGGRRLPADAHPLSRHARRHRRAAQQ